MRKYFIFQDLSMIRRNFIVVMFTNVIQIGVLLLLLLLLMLMLLLSFGSTFSGIAALTRVGMFLFRFFWRGAALRFPLPGLNPVLLHRGWTVYLQ
jgi:hypothetical protein